MAYIYKITNQINQKLYIGKTDLPIEERFKQHCKDSKKPRNEKRPLYDAMNKYGIENFHIELIEETNSPDEREVYWIEYYGSFGAGYNATRGGDGTHYANYELIHSLFLEGKNIKEIQEITGHDKTTIRHALQSFNISADTIKQRGYTSFSKEVAKIDKDSGEILEIYKSIADAEKANGNSRHIVDVCKGKRKLCKGYKWKYLSDL